MSLEVRAMVVLLFTFAVVVMIPLVSAVLGALSGHTQKSVPRVRARPE